MPKKGDISDDFERLKNRIDAMEEAIKGELKVREVMTPNVITVEKEVTIQEAAHLMEQYDISCVVVLNGHEPIGILTERDIVRKVVLRGIDKGNCVEDAMTSPLISTQGNIQLRVAAIGMERNKIRRLPVIEDGQLKGILTVTDILKTPPSYSSLF